MSIALAAKIVAKNPSAFSLSPSCRSVEPLPIIDQSLVILAKLAASPEMVTLGKRGSHQRYNKSAYQPLIDAGLVEKRPLHQRDKNAEFQWRLDITDKGMREFSRLVSILQTNLK